MRKLIKGISFVTEQQKDLELQTRWLNAFAISPVIC